MDFQKLIQLWLQLGCIWSNQTQRHKRNTHKNIPLKKPSELQCQGSTKSSIKNQKREEKYKQKKTFYCKEFKFNLKITRCSHWVDFQVHDNVDLIVIIYVHLKKKKKRVNGSQRVVTSVSRFVPLTLISAVVKTSFCWLKHWFQCVFAYYFAYFVLQLPL